MSTLTRTAPTVTRRPHSRLVRFLLAVAERAPGYAGAARTARRDDGTLERETSYGPTLPLGVIIAARVGLLLAGAVLTASALITTAWAIATEIGA